jgi:hypothetical protein
VEARLSVQGEDSIDGLEELSDWLRQESELRGHVRAASEPGLGELGALPDVLIAAISGGGALSVLAASLKAFLTQPRRSDVRIVVSGHDGRVVELDAKRINDVEALVRQVLEPAE